MSVFGAFANLADECPICLTPLHESAENGGPIILQPCGHVVHAECWGRASAHRRRCPECRAFVARPPPLVAAYGLSAASQRVIDQFMVGYEGALEAEAREWVEFGPDETDLHYTATVFAINFDWRGVARMEAWAQLEEGQDNIHSGVEGTIQYYAPEEDSDGDDGEEGGNGAEIRLTVDVVVGDETHEVFRQFYAPDELLFMLANQPVVFFDHVRDVVTANAALVLT